MTVQEVCRGLVDAGVLFAFEAEEQAARWTTGDGNAEDGNGFLDFLVGAGIVTALQRRALTAGITPPFTIGPYRVLDRITVGRLGTTVRGWHTEFEQPVCLKVFPVSEEDRDSERATRLARETRVAIQARDPHVIRTFQVGRLGRFVFHVVESLDGETLADRLEREGRLPSLEAFRIARQIALGLAHLHDLGIVHRDLQPRNVWLHRDGRALLTEFALARDELAYLDADESTSESGGGFTFSEDAIGNYDYMAAEQGVDVTFADERSDLYALGCVLFRMLTGQVVFPDANPVRKMLRHALTEAARVSECGDGLTDVADELVANLVAKDPDARYQRAADVAYALEQFISGDVLNAVATDEINPDFLEWANATPDLAATKGDPTLVADPGFLDFLEFVTEADPAGEE